MDIQSHLHSWHWLVKTEQWLPSRIEVQVTLACSMLLTWTTLFLTGQHPVGI